ncbi:MAG: helix-turn-helix transcriptional regulator [Oscillospiraceae bacterium]|nr:helix-turn-helix transcriptional regulator [Oscillospiraceae bacterium]
MNTYEKIKSLCDDRGIKLSVLAENTGIRNSVFTELKMGRTKQLSTATLDKIARFFGVPVSFLLSDPDSADDKKEQLFKKRMLLFDISQKASEEDLDTIIKLVDALVGE